MPEKMRNARRDRLKAIKKYVDAGWAEIPRMDELTDEQWALAGAAPAFRIRQRGRPAKNARKVLNGILFYIRNAFTWANIPPDYPHYSILYRHYRQWSKNGVLEQVIFALTRHLAKCSGLKYEDALHNHQLSFRQKGGTFTIYLPQEYSIYWMQPTAALFIMWLVVDTVEMYGEAYRRACKDLQVDRLLGQHGPRKVRPNEVEIVVGPNSRVIS